MLLLRFFIELNNDDFGAEDGSCSGVGGGGGGPRTEIPLLRSTDPTVKTDIPAAAAAGSWIPVSICKVRSPDPGFGFLEGKSNKSALVLIYFYYTIN